MSDETIHILDRENRAAATCGAALEHVGRHYFYDAAQVNCDACLARWYRAHRDGLLKIIREQDEAARGFSLRWAKGRDAALALEQYMSDLSEECYCAGWLIGTEDTLWNFVQNGPGRWGQGDVTAENIAELKRLSDAAGGWWEWVEGIGCMFVPLDMWKASP